MKRSGSKEWGSLVEFMYPMPARDVGVDVRRHIVHGLLECEVHVMHVGVA